MNHPQVVALYDEIVAAKVRLTRALSNNQAMHTQWREASNQVAAARQELERLQTEWNQLATEKA